MHETTIEVDGGQMYYRYNDFDASRPTVLFIHGIGESGFCFLEAFQAPLLSDFNIVVPDLLGFGRSSPAADQDYTFSKPLFLFAFQVLQESLVSWNVEWCFEILSWGAISSWR